ncbi:cupin [Thalassotalea euphylliae]|uniref:Cupin n=2 Tax=Thalassotalea euphylliae TaxID=1655234 RepID=A0A3E0TPL2_9GAMM|nr:cupin [Thalassotalea euphylliae]
MDFNQRVVISSEKQEWLASPKAGVWRKPLAREHAEQGHATSIVKYDAGASFSAHNHPLGEEILVLDGVFSDQTGDYPAGTYIRNPKGFVHAPYSTDGCTLLVKLHQFQAADSAQIRVDTKTAAWQRTPAGNFIMPLHKHQNESVALIKLSPGSTFTPADELIGGQNSRPDTDTNANGEEIYILSGSLKSALGSHAAGSWLRSPYLNDEPYFAEADTVIWIKSGHLPQHQI